MTADREAAIRASEKHPHEPQIPAALDEEGRCFVCAWLFWSDGRYPDDSPGDVIAAEPDGTITLDDGITTWNPLRALAFREAELAAAREEGDEWREATRIGAERLIQAREEAESWKRLAYHYQSLLGERGLL